MANEFTDTNITGTLDVSGNFTVGGGAGGSGIDLNSDGTAAFDGAISPDGGFSLSSSYKGSTTPAVTGIVNITGSPANGVLNWTRHDDAVWGDYRVVATPTAGSGTTTSVRFAIPVASNFVATSSASGSAVGNASTDGNLPVFVQVDATNDQLQLVWFPTTGAEATTIRGTFYYKII